MTLPSGGVEVVDPTWHPWTPRADIIEFTEDGIPFLVPEIVLLFKAKLDKQKDRDDLARVVPHLSEKHRDWLVDAIELVHPGHSWLSEPLA